MQRVSVTAGQRTNRTLVLMFIYIYECMLCMYSQGLALVGALSFSAGPQFIAVNVACHDLVLRTEYQHRTIPR